ncbi:MAG: antitoxin VapB family protein [Nanoarchaeota archaeon]
MGSINIAIKKEAYEFLKSLKGNERSFSDVILEFRESKRYKRGSKEAILSFAGVLKNKGIDWEARKRIMKEFRNEVEERMDETAKYMEKLRKK